MPYSESCVYTLNPRKVWGYRLVCSPWFVFGLWSPRKVFFTHTVTHTRIVVLYAAFAQYSVDGPAKQSKQSIYKTFDTLTCNPCAQSERSEFFVFVFLILIKQINTLSYLSSSCTSIANLNYEVINPSKNSQEITVPAKITFRGGDFVAFESNSIKFQRNVKFQALSMLKWGAAPASDCLSLVHFLSSIWKSLYIKSTPEATTFWRDPTQKWDCESPR